MSRYSDVALSPRAVRAAPAAAAYSKLPAVDWASIGASCPAPVAVDYKGPDEPLPNADIALLTWTSAEWSALDHVFLKSTTAGVRDAYELEQAWHLYGRDVNGAATDHPMAPLWGYYQLVEIAGLRVLLFKCDAHLAHPPWLSGLEQMTRQVLRDTKPAWIYSIGTAGGANPNENLGDAVIANAGHLEMKAPENAAASINHLTFSCKAFPKTTVMEELTPLLFKLSDVVTESALQGLVQTLHTQTPDSAPFGLADLLDAPLDPANLGQPKALPKPGVPLLSTDYYFIASGDDAEQWSVLEMDDAVIAYVAGEEDTNYAFVRNISDPVVPTVTAHKRLIPDSVRDRWSGLIYENYGAFTSFNGALVSWAAIAAGA
jgi:hypothetical protein